MDKPQYFIEEGIRRFYDEKGFCIKEEGFSKLFKISYEKDKEKKMIAEKSSKSIEQAVCYELQNIVKEYGAVYASEHEAYAVLKEEVEEAADFMDRMNKNLAYIWALIKNNHIWRGQEAIAGTEKFAVELAEEAVQCAAVCERFLDTIKREEKV